MKRNQLKPGDRFLYQNCMYHGHQALVAPDGRDDPPLPDVDELPRGHLECGVKLCGEISHLDQTDHPPPTTGDLKSGRGDKKPPLQWVPLWALTGMARVFAYGARKYAPGNWQKAAADGARALEDYMSAFMRHWGAIQEADSGGVAKWDSIDEESGLPHLDHAICSLVMLRGIAILSKILPRDPGRGNDPIKVGNTGGRKP